MPKLKNLPWSSSAMQRRCQWRCHCTRPERRRRRWKEKNPAPERLAGDLCSGAQWGTTFRTARCRRTGSPALPAPAGRTTPTTVTWPPAPSALIPEAAPPSRAAGGEQLLLHTMYNCSIYMGFICNLCGFHLWENFADFLLSIFWSYKTCYNYGCDVYITSLIRIMMFKTTSHIGGGIYVPLYYSRNL